VKNRHDLWYGLLTAPRFRALALAAAATMAIACAKVADNAGTAADSSAPAAGSASRPPGSLLDWLADMRSRVQAIPNLYASDRAKAQAEVLDIYIYRQEYIELYYGDAGKVSRGGELGTAVMEAERMFHDLMLIVGPTSPLDLTHVRSLTDSLDKQLVSVGDLAEKANVPLIPPDSADASAALTSSDSSAAAAAVARTVAGVRRAQALSAGGYGDSAKLVVEAAYLEDFETVEPLLPSGIVASVEELVHMRLRPALAAGADPQKVDSLFTALAVQLERAHESLGGDRSVWFGVISSFLIIVREGLEAALLIAAMIAYLSRSEDVRSQRKHVYAGAAVAVVASLATWLVARTLIPIAGGSRELMEGVTALVAVAVLLYVSHWIFRRTYMGEWKNYLHGKVVRAVTAGSGAAIAFVSFAAVYREGFETVLFYQALLVDLPVSSVVSGFGAGAVVILALSFGIIRLGLKLPLRIVFRATNAVLLFLSIAILGKGLYNLQEAGLFNPHPLEWLPSNEVLRHVIGYYPMVETLLAQAALITLIFVMYVVYRRRSDTARGRAAA
jgi:FTR1 family protein